MVRNQRLINLKNTGLEKAKIILAYLKGREVVFSSYMNYWYIM